MAFLRVLCFVLLVGLAAACQPNCPKCPPLWTYYDGYCYRYFGTAKSFDDAEEHCRQFTEFRQGHLVTIADEEENSIIYAFWRSVRGATPGNLWIGYTDVAEEGTFISVDKSAMDFTDWANNQPDNSNNNENCGVMWRRSDDGSWNDSSCNKNAAYICKMATRDGPDRRTHRRRLH